MKNLKVPRYIHWISYNAVIFLLLMTVLRLALVFSFRQPAHSIWDLQDALLLGMRYDLRIVCVISLVFFIIGIIPALHPLDKKWGQRISFWIWIVFIIIFTLFYVIDFANYAYLSQRLTAGLLSYLGDAKISMGMVWQTYHVGWVLLALVLVIAGLLALVRSTYNVVLSKPKKATKQSRIIWSIVFFLLLGIGIFGRVGQYPLRWSDAFEFGDDYKAAVSLNPFQSFFSSLEFRKSTFDRNKVGEHYAFMSNYFGVDKPDSTTLNFDRIINANDSVKERPNVIVVICESFSAYKSSMYGNPLNTTPFFKSLCDKGIFFDRCFTPAYGTARGVWATVTGIPDVQLVNTSSRNPASVDQHSIINNFKGYEKYYFIGGSTSWANIRGLLTNNINDLHLYEQSDYKAPKVDVWGISDKNLFLEANRILTEQQEKQPFFAVIQTADNHRPYTIPKEDEGAFVKKDVPKDTLKKYGFETVDEYNAFRYTDFSYEKFIEAASQSPYFKNTIFVFVGDHGIRGSAGKMLPDVFTTQGLTNEHVPLLFYSPAKLQPKRYSFLASQVDVLPTVAGLCNISYTNTAMGQDLLSKKILADSGKNNADFIFDFDNKRIGIIYDSLYYSYGINNSSPEQISSFVDNRKIVLTDSLQRKYRNLTDAFYETARYLLFNNKKRK
jgi:phosphoglycerol transferase MdoB-like AlkP superfamily enzyme